jgi:hypothetical protein
MLGPCGEASAIAGPERPDWIGLVEAAEELQMVDISLLFWRAEVVFFLNLHNALMLHTHMHRGTAAGEGLRSIKGTLFTCFTSAKVQILTQELGGFALSKRAF